MTWGRPYECASARCSKSDIEVSEETAESVENTEEVDDIEVSEESEEREASELREEDVDTVESGESKDTDFRCGDPSSESESESTVRLMESSGSVPNRDCCSGVR